MLSFGRRSLKPEHFTGCFKSADADLARFHDPGLLFDREVRNPDGEESEVGLKSAWLQEIGRNNSQQTKVKRAKNLQATCWLKILCRKLCKVNSKNKIDLNQR
jgi:hypothetical protein